MISRLPAVRVQALPPRTTDFLPRMDIPLFVGFAQDGPLTPVLIHDMVQFTQVYGEPQVLCWDAEDGRPVQMLLSGTVRAFFENGGRQCYVLRVNPHRITHEDRGASWSYDLNDFRDARLDADNVRTLGLQVDSWRLASSTPHVGFDGIHAFLELPDVAFISVPDAVHHGWVHREVYQVSVVTPPEPAPEVVPDLPVHPGAFDACEVKHTPILTDPYLFANQEHEDLVITFRASRLFYGVGIIKYELRVQTDADVKTYPLQPGTHFVLSPEMLGVGFFDLQVVATCAASALTAFSNKVRVRVSQVRKAFRRRTAPREDLLVLHQRMLLACAYRADTLSILSLPRTAFGALVRYAATLRKSLPSGVSRYGSLYAPQIRFGQTELPPDGPVLGLLASQALTRGSWVAAANQPFREVTEVLQVFRDPQRLALQEARVNTLFSPPAGILNHSALTLSLEEMHQNVRLLLHLLRRYLERLGSTFVFEPNSPRSRAGMKRQIEDALEILFRRGAFRGRTPQESYQVAVLSGPENAVMFEIRVNPSVPMTHLTVTLVQVEDGLRLQE